MHEQVPLEPGLQTAREPGGGRVREQSQFVENSSAKVVGDHREAVVGALELQGDRREGSITAEALLSPRRGSASRPLHTLPPRPPPHLVLELIVEVSLLFLGPDHVHDLAVLWEAGGAVGIALRVALEAVLVEGVAAEEVHRRQLQGAVTDAALSFLENLRTVGGRPEWGQV